MCCGVWGNTLLLSGNQEMLDKRYEELEGINTGELLEFERAYLNGEHALQPESGYPLPFHPGDYGLVASLWGFEIEGETPAADAVVAP